LSRIFFKKFSDGYADRRAGFARGLKGAPKPIRPAIETIAVDRRARDLSAVAEALRFNPRAADPSHRDEADADVR
jgi:hypothetical protein